MERPITVATPFLALTTASGAIPYNAADNVFSAYAIGPDLNNLSIKDDRTSYQWAFRNDGQAQKIVQELDIDSPNPTYVHRDKRGKVDAIALPPLELANILTSTIDAVPGIDINIQPVQEAYSQTETKRPLTVAIMDADVDISHPDLQGSIWVNEDEIPGDDIDNDGNGFVDDINGWNFYSNTNQICEGPEDVHGTHVANTIAASKDNNDIVGIADNNYVKIMPVKTLGGERGESSSDNAIAAIKYAKANGTQICGLGFGPQNYTEEFKAAIRDSGMLFIVAAGNGDDNAVGYDIDTSLTYPASLPLNDVITVANLIFDGKLDESSSFDAGSMDIAAPNTFVLDIAPDNGYTFMSGTSMTAPMVTGTVAMLYTSGSELNLTDIKNIILASTHKMDSLNGKVLSGGVLDASGAIQWGRQ